MKTANPGVATSVRRQAQSAQWPPSGDLPTNGDTPSAEFETLHCAHTPGPTTSPHTNPDLTPKTGRFDQTCRHARHEDLATMTDRYHPCRPVQRRTEIVLAALLDLTGGDAHPYRQPQQPLCIHRRMPPHTQCKPFGASYTVGLAAATRR